MTDTKTCSTCGMNISEGSAVGGLCPMCLLKAAGSMELRSDAEVLAGLIGRTIDGKYRIDRPLGSGGMGAVFLATHVGTERPVALKVLAPRLMDDEEFVERFRREARAAGRLRHPNIVNVTDFGFVDVGESADEGTLAYLVMEYLDGTSLAEYVGNKVDRPLEWVGDIVEQIALAVDEAHARGVIHRDLKPANIWLVPDGRGGHIVKVLDFGLAKMRGLQDVVEVEPGSLPVVDHETATLPMADRPANPTDGFGKWHSAARITGAPVARNTRPVDHGDRRDDLTRTGVVLGTPQYMSPEQCRGDAIDGRSDIYSLGIVAYELVTGALPFGGDTAALLRQHSDRPPLAVHEVRQGLPASINEAVQPALAKCPSDRPETATAFAESLKAALRTSGEHPSTILSEAFALYGRHFGLFLRLSPICGAIPFVATALACAIANAFGDPGLHWAEIVVCCLLAWLVGGVVTSGVITPLVAHLSEHPTQPFDLRPAFRSAIRSLGLYALTALRPTRRSAAAAMMLGCAILFLIMRPEGRAGLFTVIAFIWGSAGSENNIATFSGAVAILEHRGPHDAALRTTTLLDRLEAVHRWKFAGGESLVSLAVLGCLTGALAMPLLAFQFDTRDRGVLMAVVAVSTAIGALVLNPLLAMCTALRYCKARRLGGESLVPVADLVRRPATHVEPGTPRTYEWSSNESSTHRLRVQPVVPHVSRLWVLAAGMLFAAAGTFALTFVPGSLPYAITPLVPLLAVGVAAAIPVVWGMLRGYRTIVSDELVSVPTLRGRRTCHWDAVSYASESSGLIHITDTLGSRVALNPGDFKHGEEVRAYVVHQLERRGKRL